jgi:MerR family transcriptional regulator, light-induced transcriptional regulator
MGQYQINDLERLIGVRAHTIRIWEKRYGLIRPRRTSANIRLYSEEQVKKLLNVTTLLRAGQKISHIAALSEQEIRSRVAQLAATDMQDIVAIAFLQEMIQAMLGYNEPAFDRVYRATVQRFGLYEAMRKVIYPFLVKTGVLWSVDQALPVQEHFASGLIRRKLMAAIDGLGQAIKQDKRFVLFLPPGEWHEIPLLFSEFLIRSAAYPVINLGQNVPYEQLSEVLRHTKPTHVLFFLVAGAQQAEAALLLNNMQQAHPDIQYMVSGNIQQLENLATNGNVLILKEPAAIFSVL